MGCIILTLIMSINFFGDSLSLGIIIWLQKESSLINVWCIATQCLMWVRKSCISHYLAVTLYSGLSLTPMRPRSKDSHWKTAFKKAGFFAEKCGESMTIFVNVNVYVSKSCAAISGEFLKSSEMAAHYLNAYIWILFPCFCIRKYQKF